MPICDGCGAEVPTTYRLLYEPHTGYCGENSKALFLCKQCSIKKLDELKDRGYIEIPSFEELFGE